MTDDNKTPSNDYLWTGEGEDELGVAALEKQVASLRLSTKARPRRRRAWLAPLVASVALALAAFATLAPDQIPTRFLGLFTDAPVTPLSLDGGSVIEVDVVGADSSITERVGDLMRRRGAAVTYTREGKIIVELPTTFGADASRWAELITTRGKMSLGWSRSELPDETVEAARGSPALELTSTGVKSRDREALLAFLRSQALPVSERWALERLHGSAVGLPEWSAHALSDTRLSWKGFARGRLTFNPQSNTYEVIAELFEEDVDGFAELTGANLGRRLAILLDDEVLTAPVVAAKIDGGEVAISLGDDLATSEAVGRALVSVIGSAEIDAELRIAHIETVYPRIGPAAMNAARGLLALGLGLLVFFVGWMVERRASAIDPHVSPIRGVRIGRVRHLGGVLVTAAIVAAVALLARLPLADANEPDGWVPLLGDLAALPLFGGFALAALVGVLIPALSRRAGTIRFVALSVALGLLLNIVLISVPQLSGWSLGFHGTTTLQAAHIAFFAGALILAWLGTRFGNTNGCVAVGLGFLLVPTYTTALNFSAMTFVELFRYLALAAVVAFATAYLLRRPLWVGRSDRRRVAFGWSAVALGAVTVDGLAIFAPGLLGPLAGVPVTTIAVVAFALVFAGLHFRRKPASGPKVVGEGIERSLRLLAIAAIAGAAYIVVLSWDAGYYAPLGPLGIAFLTAVSLDDLADWKAFYRNPELTSAAKLDDPRLADPVADALLRAGIDVHLRTQYVRHLLGPLGTFAPVNVMVPHHRLDEARTVIAGQL